MKTGVGTIAQAGIQTTFGTSVVPTAKLNLSSESITVTQNKTDEGNLLASKTAAQRDLVSVDVGGGMSLILRPEFADWLFQAALGVGSDNVYTLAAPNADLPISTLVVSRGGIVKTYPDITISSLTINATAQDYVKVDIELTGTKELDSSDSGAQTVQSLSFTLPSYKCTSAVLKYGTAGATPSTTICVENTQISINNNLQESPATYCTGLYKGRPAPGLREVGVNFQLPFSSDTDTFRSTYYKTEDATLSLELTFTTSDADESITILLPHVCLTSGDNNVGGTGIIEASFAGIALSVDDDEPITVTVTHAE